MKVRTHRKSSNVLLITRARRVPGRAPPSAAEIKLRIERRALHYGRAQLIVDKLAPHGNNAARGWALLQCTARGTAQQILAPLREELACDGLRVELAAPLAEPLVGAQLRKAAQLKVGGAVVQSETRLPGVFELYAEDARRHVDRSTGAVTYSRGRPYYVDAERGEGLWEVDGIPTSNSSARGLMTRVKLSPIPSAWTAKQLEDLCSRHGRVIEARVLRENAGNSAGLIKMVTERDAAVVVKEFNGRIVQGAALMAQVRSE